MVRQAPVICVMAPPIHLGAWSMALMLWLPFELLLLSTVMANNEEGNDSCMYNTKLFFCTYIVDGALAQPKSSITSK